LFGNHGEDFMHQRMIVALVAGLVSAIGFSDVFADTPAPSEQRPGVVEKMPDGTLDERSHTAADYIRTMFDGHARVPLIIGGLRESVWAI
jgi:hypothetical protein